MTYAILLYWQQAQTQQPIGVVGLVIIHVTALVTTEIAARAQAFYLRNVLMRM